MSAAPTAARLRRARQTRARVVSRSAAVVCGLVVLAIVIGLVFAGSPKTLAEGVSVAGVDVGGLTAPQAERVLERRAGELRHVPVTFVAGSQRFELTPAQLDVKVDWSAAVAAAQHEGDGFAPVRGLRRLGTRVFGTDVAPPARVYEPALTYALGKVGRGVDRRPREASIVLHGLRPATVPGHSGLALDRDAAADVIVRALAAFSRSPVGLPVRIEDPRVSAAELRPVAAKVRTALSAPVRLRLGERRWRIPRWRIATLLSLPADGRSTLTIGGPAATHWFARLARRVDRPAADAGFAVHANNTVDVVPARAGLALDVRATAKGLLAGALSQSHRSARMVVETSLPKRSTAEARAMHITRLVKGYTTEYGGDPNRLHNVRLVAQLIDKTLVAPGATFSFNAATGERTADKGFLEAPVIINGELQNGLGGGVCQVSTTVFNAAYEAGLPILERTNHALYISHYPQGRDATVNYPDLDLRFRNDTGNWMLLRTWVGDSSLTVALYGRPTGRRVESDVQPLVETGAPGVKEIEDPSLYVGERVVEESGEPSRATSVRRRVYNRQGRLIDDSTWSSSYRSEPEVVRVGTKPRPQPPPPPAPEKPKATTTTPAKPPKPATTTPANPAPQPPPAAQTGGFQQP